MFRLTNVIPERIIFVSRGITVLSSRNRLCTLMDASELVASPCHGRTLKRNVYMLDVVHSLINIHQLLYYT